MPATLEGPEQGTVYSKNVSRREFAKRNAGKPRNVLEIGALNTPVFSGNGVSFADWFSTDELVVKYPHKSNIVPVDYVINKTKFSENFDRTFGIVIANHVIEHVPDVIGWLDQLSAIVEPGGWAIMAIPDKRYTFDILRRESTFSDLLDCAHRRLERPSIGHLIDHLYLHRKVDHKSVWSGVPIALGSPRMSLSSAVKKAFEMSESYHSVHCHVFTDESFRVVFSQLEEADLTQWKLVDIQPPLPGSNEFLVALRNWRV